MLPTRTSVTSACHLPILVAANGGLWIKWKKSSMTETATTCSRVDCTWTRPHGRLRYSRSSGNPEVSFEDKLPALIIKPIAPRIKLSVPRDLHKARNRRRAGDRHVEALRERDVQGIARLETEDASSIEPAS